MSEVRCTAVVPALDENERIGAVLEALAACALVSDIVVVDDGSREPLSATVSAFPRTRCIRHERTAGKAAAMDDGVRATDAPFVLFCDADLIGFRPEHAAALIEPVTSGRARMTIGLRDNPEQRAVYWFAINSGERCLPREDWLSLPPFYKQGFRIEAGLNVRAWLRSFDVLHLAMPYRNTVRERKYGFWRGVRSRLRLSFDVSLAWAHALVTRAK